jgi:5-deoxy-5-amino-3-dehydroquinate synthase
VWSDPAPSPIGGLNVSEQPARASTRGPHLILIGPMGSGKTTIAHALGRRLHRPVRDSDEELVAALGIDAKTILRREGRDALHVMERRVLAASLVGTVPSVIAAAAGDVDDETSGEQMRHGATVIYLRVPRDELIRRIGDGSTRPIDGSAATTLATTEAGREPRYTGLADLTVDADGADPETIVDAILAGLARRVEVPLGERSYEVQIGPGALSEVAALIPSSARRAAIVTQANIGIEIDPHLEAQTFFIADGESAKSMSTIETLCREFSRFGLTRADVVIAVGGGVVTDAAGFAAACYHRGTALLNVPTTLLGQIDAAVGGKTAVNIPEGKNLVGAFWQPCGVLCDTETLRSLPEREWRSGLGEMAKYAFLGVEDLDELPLVDQVARCLALKADVVGSDEREGGRRMILNYGHTLAHALEAAGFADGPGRGGIDLRHGEAVAIGLVFAARLAQLLGRIDERRVDRHRQLLATYDLPTEIPYGVDPDEMVFRMARDKKATAGIVFVLDGPNGVEPVRGVEADVIEAALAATSAVAPKVTTTSTPAGR